MSITRVERSGGNLDVTYTEDGTPSDPDANVVTVGIIRADGSVLAGPGAATTRIAAGVYRYVLEPQAQLDFLTLTATATFDGRLVPKTIYIDVVGGFHFTEAAARATDASFVNPPYTDNDLISVRAAVEDAIERTCGRAFVRRFRRARVSGDGSSSLWLPDVLPRVVISLSVGGVPFTQPELATLVLDDAGEIIRPYGRSPAGRNNVVVAYEYGEDAPPPIIKRAGLLLFKRWLPAFKDSDSSGVGVRSRTIGNFSESYFESGELTGVTEVDRLIKTWRGNGLVFA